MSGHVCPSHRRQPVIIYGACVGCELERERAAVEALKARCRQLEERLQAQQCPVEDSVEQLTLRLLGCLTGRSGTFALAAQLAQELQRRGVRPYDALGGDALEGAGRDQLLLALARHRMRERHYFERCVELEAERNDWKAYAAALQQGR